MSARHIALLARHGPAEWFNVRAANLQLWRAALGRVAAGTGRAKLVFIGDSTAAGTGSGSGGSFVTNARPTSFPEGCATLLNAGTAVQDGSFFGEAGMSAIGGLGGYDTRVTLGANWGAFSGVNTMGGLALKYTSGSGATTLTFAPVPAFDHLRIWYIQQASQGTFTTDIDGGASLGTTNTVGAGQTVQHQDYTVAKATHTIHINAQNNGQLAILGVETWDSTVPAVDFVLAGWHGSKTANWAGASAWFGSTFIQTLAPDLTVVDLTVNDSNAATLLSTYTTQMQTIITGAKVTGDVLLMVGPPSNTTQATDGTLDTYIATLQSLALSNNVGLLDIKKRWHSYAAINPVFPYADTLHPTAPGYVDIASAVRSAFMVTA